MVDTPKESDGNEATEDNTLEKQSKHRRHRRHFNLVIAKIVIPAQEIIILQIVPKTTTIPSSKI